MTVGSLFSGIGCMGLGLERAGFELRWQVEIEPFPRAVLERHWPGVPKHEDIHDVGSHNLEPVDLICAGWPCQDISHAGRRAGIQGGKSGLWAELHRVVRELRPRFVLLENSPSIVVRGLGRVLGDLAGIGYDAEWDCVPAAAVGAPHLRAREWILAYPRGERHGPPKDTVFAGRDPVEFRGRWADEPSVPRVDDGAPDGVQRRRALGNAVVPQIPEWIGLCIKGAA